MTYEKLISIIVPIYNSSKVIQRCIDSILMQSYKNWELILINDGSVDNSLAICSMYKKANSNIYIIDKENGGVSSARNAGLALSKGEYICFVDSDDSLSPSYLSCLMQSIECNNADLAICGMNIISSGCTKKMIPASAHIEGKIEIANFVQRHYLEWMISSPCGKLYKRKHMPLYGFEKKISLGEDLKFNIEYFSRIKSLEIQASALYNYFDTEGSLTKSYKPEHLDSIIDIYDLTKKFIENIEGANRSLFKYVNYKLFSFCISFMSQNMRNCNKIEEKKFIKQIINNENLQNAILFLPRLDFVRYLYAKAIRKKYVNVLYYFTWLKFMFIDKYRMLGKTRLHKKLFCKKRKHFN